ncbi:MAG: hypothetical protein INQ03_09695 [Candidatus Heimdallarchaeota archaeon]|nr:hypothetical protein [Candidatus Heimdallarchaeota archaeon]
MNGAAHYLVGMIWTVLIYSKLDDTLLEKPSLSKEYLGVPFLTYMRILTIFIFNYFFHIFIDVLAQFTYHPSNSSWGDPIYATWHIFTYIAEAAVAIYALKKDLRYSWGLIGSVGFDLWDWSIVRFTGKYLGTDLPTVHFMEGWVRSTFFFYLPNWTLHQWAMINEVLLLVIFFFIWFKLVSKWPLPGSHPGKMKSISILVIIFGIWRLMSLF